MKEDAHDHHVFFRNVKKDYPTIVRGQGIYLYDEAGNEYIDGCSGALVSNIGHGVEEVAEALSQQARTLAFAHLSRFGSEPIRTLGARIAEISPGDLDRIYLVSGGSEATEASLKMARQYFLERDGQSQKHLVISRWNSFHGNTIGAMSMSGITPRRRLYQPYLLDFPHINAPYCYRCPYEDKPDHCDVSCARELETALKRVGPEYVSAFIAEPIVGAAAGALVPPPAYWPLVREICDEYDILLIADEVMTGFGRTGAHFGVDHWSIVPDLMPLAKGMGSGYMPLGAVLVRESIWQVFWRGSGRFIHGHTYGGSPLASAGGVAVMEYYMKHALAERARRAGQRLASALEPLLDISTVGDVRGLGLMMGVELVADSDSKRPFSSPAGVMAERATEILLDEGLVVYPGGGTVDGSAGDHFLVGPPLVISDDEIDLLANRLFRGLEKFDRVANRD